MLWIELIILLACIVVGARLGGIGLGTAGGLGLMIFVFLFNLPPGSPPGIVLGMIIAVITALAAMQASGGLDYLISIAARIMKKKPQYITVVAPLVTYVLVFASGTQHVIYALLPVISEVSMKAGIRPERPVSISVIAAQHALIASPISAATVALLASLVSYDITLVDILIVIIPATLLGIIVGILSVAWRGKSLDEDPEYLARIKSGKIKASNGEDLLAGRKLSNARNSLLLFLFTILIVVIIGIFPELRPKFDMYSDAEVIQGEVSMGQAIMIIMLAAAGLMMIFFKANPAEVVKGSIMRGGIVAVISILGISWMGSSFFEGNRPEIVNGITGIIQQSPWIFAIGLFVLSMLLFSQAATIVTLMPVAVSMGLPGSILIAVYPAVNGYFFLPTYGTILAAVSFDQTGTTRIGKCLLNHSFMRPGLVVTISATIFSLILSSIMF